MSLLFVEGHEPPAAQLVPVVLPHWLNAILGEQWQKQKEAVNEGPAVAPSALVSPPPPRTQAENTRLLHAEPTTPRGRWDMSIYRHPTGLLNDPP